MYYLSFSVHAYHLLHGSNSLAISFLLGRWPPQSLVARKRGTQFIYKLTLAVAIFDKLYARRFRTSASPGSQRQITAPYSGRKRRFQLGTMFLQALFNGDAGSEAQPSMTTIY